MSDNIKISVITPSIRPDGAGVTMDTLSEQTFKEFEWLPRLSLIRDRPDLNYQMNQAMKEAKGELIVFLQDFIQIKKDALQRAWDLYQKFPTVCFTFPVSKVDSFKHEDIVQARHDWRFSHQERNPDGTKDVPFHYWEIDFGSAPRLKILEAGLFYEPYDELGIGHENVDLAYRLQYAGCTFKCNSENGAIAWDHDKFEKHPWKEGSKNAELWNTRRFEIDKMNWT